jgi:hypothetical protein
MDREDIHICYMRHFVRRGLSEIFDAQQDHWNIWWDQAADGQLAIVQNGTNIGAQLPLFRVFGNIDLLISRIGLPFSFGSSPSCLNDGINSGTVSPISDESGFLTLIRSREGPDL